ncbi:helix-turn-helix domain-containing protein [Agrobacterium vitis]|uniref:helix-turn-helix domain-containing protein n=1 Tax=Agrobacterium vitis TaxID=373 RepID=UPI00135E2F3B|nr:helix-turn-helix domain-containing protein [Agrobacterium vitis]
MSGEATIRRGVRNAHYAAIPNHVFEDARLSMEARWLLSYLLSKPDNWTVVIGDIVKKGNCGRDKARKMIAELVETGYAEREQTRAGGKFGPTVLVIFDEPRQPGVASTNACYVSDTSEPTDAFDASEAADASDASDTSCSSDGPVGADAASKSVACLPQTELPSPVLPEPVKSALSNNLDLAKTDSYQGEGAREPAGDGRGAADVDDRAARRLERARIGEQFDTWFKLWPRPGNPDFARNAWFALSAEERETCIERTPAYLAWTAREDLTAPAVYLKARAWREMPEGLTRHRAQSHARTHADARTHPHSYVDTCAQANLHTSPHTHVIAKVCGKLWMGRHFQALLCEPTGQLVMTAFDERRIATGAISREAVAWEKRRDHGWPLISKMHDLAGRNEPFKTMTDILPLVTSFETVECGSALFAAWRRLHERRGWMFVDGLSDWISFPAIDQQQPDLDVAVEAALDHFTTSLKGHTHDAAEP